MGLFMLFKVRECGLEDLNETTADLRMSGIDGFEYVFDLKFELWSEFSDGLNHEMSWCSSGLRR